MKTIYKFSDENYKQVWVVASNWTEAYNLVAEAAPKMDVVEATNESKDSLVLIGE